MSVISMPLHRYGSILKTPNTIYRIITKFIKIIRELLNILYYMWYKIWFLVVNTITVTLSPWWIVYWEVCFERGVPQEVRMYSLCPCYHVMELCCFCAHFVHHPVHHVRLSLLIHMIVTTTHWGLGQMLINRLCAMDGHQIIHYIIMHYNFILEFVSIQLNLPYFLHNGRKVWLIIPALCGYLPSSSF